MQVTQQSSVSRFVRGACSTSYTSPATLLRPCTRQRFVNLRSGPRGTPVVFAAAPSQAAMDAPAEAAQTNGRPPLAYHGQGPARIARAERVTKETQVEVSINLDGSGKCVTETPVGFLNHMLDQLASHGLFDVTVKATGDTWIDDHHTVEDIALALGTAFSQALGDRKGIHRFGEFTAPLDEALCHVVLDLSGRPHCSCGLTIPAQRIGNFDTELVEHFFSSFSNTSGTTLHIRQLAGKNSHHIVECTFKAFARALRVATEYDPRRQGMIASSKGVLTQQ
mmetsp:Transcript_1112/g.2607  ORF Transcript_1112/g.2607 Transcript_1112/m.2607 type:complete len:280 (+) Transcript_1112:53-892(+)|eukprot:CAMPEP_0202352364 /NCGR_PEP_ID=MMETSP1126-20121109/8590_1 /ASSEMBLY_ACC=CAM_ASM_000457 /TAXON_ID=3047 /ORGANISM="Dunaliella tertiolecta, Strain CCMP1320" /LENGTH=279 /DNA_ID=CAMNT_0048944569 /DNA_START=29 /DNA_END=868 /DNA_ORIENTATION=-